MAVLTRSRALSHGGEGATAGPAPPLPKVTEVSEEVLRGLVNTMNRVGFAELPNYLSSGEVLELQRYVEAKVAEAGGEYVALTGKQEVAGTLLDGLSDAPAFQKLLHRIYELGTGKPAPEQGIYQVLRCLKGPSGVKQSLIFHFDSFVVTALIPIIIPTRGSAGHLIMAPNLRKERRTYFRNLVDKLLVDNKLSQLLFKFLASAAPGTFRQVAMTPGSLYLFWGYRSLHANEACDVENIRATAPFHYGDPHAQSGLRGWLGRQKV